MELLFALITGSCYTIINRWGQSEILFHVGGKRLKRSYEPCRYLTLIFVLGHLQRTYLGGGVALGVHRLPPSADNVTGQVSRTRGETGF